MGFEPTTSTLARLRSTPELHPLGCVNRLVHRLLQVARKGACCGRDSTCFPDVCKSFFRVFRVCVCLFALLLDCVMFVQGELLPVGLCRAARQVTHGGRYLLQEGR